MSSWAKCGGLYWGCLGLLAGLWVSQADAENRKFDLEDPLGRNAMAVTIESRVSPIRGLVDDVRGLISFDPATGKCSGTMKLGTESIRFVGDELTEQLVGPEWFDFVTRPKWEVTIKTVARSEQLDEETWQIAALGAMVLNGKAGGVNFPVTLTYLPGGMSDRTEGAVEGDIILLRGRISFLRDEFGVHPDPDLFDLYGNEVDLEFSLVGWSSTTTEP